MGPLRWTVGPFQQSFPLIQTSSYANAHKHTCLYVQTTAVGTSSYPQWLWSHAVSNTTDAPMNLRHQIYCNKLTSPNVLKNWTTFISLSWCKERWEPATARNDPVSFHLASTTVILASIKMGPGKNMQRVSIESLVAECRRSVISSTARRSNQIRI